MATWLASVLAALIAATAVIVTTLVNNRNTELQRRDSRAERAADREHDALRWQQERDTERQRWLLDRRRVAYLKALEYVFVDKDNDEAAWQQLGQEAELQIFAFGSPEVVAAWRGWIEADLVPGLEIHQQPSWVEFSNRMRDDLGSNPN